MRTTTGRSDRALGIVVWLCLVAGLGVDQWLTGWSLTPDRTAAPILLGVFFLAVIVRLGNAVRRRRHRRAVPAVLVLGIALWAVESAVLQDAPTSSHSVHLAGGELAFLICYPVIALFLLLDADQRPSRMASTWLEAAIACGGCASLAGILLLAFVPHGTVPSLVGLVYPVLDVGLLLVVVTQSALRVRARDRHTAALAIGLVLLAAADSTFVGNVERGSTGSSIVTAALWGVAFALIASAASRLPKDAQAVVDADAPAAVLVTATLAAVAVLVVHPDSPLGMALVVPAVVTVIAAGGRLVFALRQARGAAEAVRLASTDDLTLLPNRRAILARLDSGLAGDGPLALMMIDLNGFKEINDSLGHGHGDAILRTLAQRMRAQLPAAVLTARLGGDEFALLVPETDEVELLDLANTVLTAIRQPIDVDGIELVVSASIGITVRTEGDTHSSALLRRADVAMYQAKASDEGPLLYDAGRDVFSRHRIEIVEDLRRGIGAGQLELYYQPQLDASSQRVVSVEALVRWNHPTLGLQNPVAFLPAARQAGLMPLLSEAVILRAVQDLQRWRRVGFEPRVSLNCAPPELLSGIFVRQLTEAVARAGLRIDCFVLEVTEDSFVSDPERARDVLADARHNGLEISIDDYGTGFSSLTYLRDLPVDELKMDRSFVFALAGDPRAQMIVESTVKLAHALDLRLVAEGVEDSATAMELIAMGVDTMQGYHFARPMPAGQVAGWVSEWTTRSLDFAPPLAE